jgi:hypothetical protein
MSDYRDTAAVAKTPVVVDYTNRDFYSLREELISRVKDRVNNNGSANKWYGNDASDFGVALVESFAYMGDVIGYYIDRMANESTLLTATQRESVINLARSYGYNPAGYKAATTTIQFSNSTNAVDLPTIPAGAQVSGSITDGDTVRKVIFTTTDAVVMSATASVSNISGSGTVITYTAANTFVEGQRVTVTGASVAGYNVTGATIATANSTTFTVAGATTGAYTGTVTASATIPAQTVTAFHGEDISLRSANQASSPTDIAGEVLGASDGSPDQIFRLKENQVVQDRITVYVQTGDNYGVWTEVLHLTDYGTNDAVYRVVTDASNNVYIQFGDGVSGAIPTTNATIKVRYYVGGGLYGNVPINALTSASFAGIGGLTGPQSSALTAAVRVTNTSLGSGGTDPDSLDAIRNNAPAAFAALSRAVTLTDYIGLAVSVSGVGKANAIADVWNSVTVYVAPYRSELSTELYPGKDDGNLTILTELTDLQAKVLSELTPKLQIGTTLTVSPPTYSPVSLEIKYSVRTPYSNSDVESAIKSYMTAYYSYSQTSFEQIVAPEEIEFILRYVPGLYNVRVVSLYRTAETTALTTLIGAPGEVLVFTAENTVLTPLNTTASLSALAATNSSTGLSPTFASAYTDYTLTVNSGSSSTDISATGSVGTTVRINGSASPKTIGMSASVSSVTGASGVMTYTTSAAHNFAAGQKVTVTGASPSGYNVTAATITSASGSTFTVAGATTGTSSGTIAATIIDAKITVAVTAEDGTTVKKYTITANK